MSKRAPKKLRRDERKRRAEQKAGRISSCFDRRVVDACVAMGDEQLLALEVLADHCPGLAQRDLDAAACTVLEAAASTGMPPMEVAIHLLALRDKSAAEQEIDVPDPEQRAELAGFLASRGPSASRLLAALETLYAEGARFSRATEQEARANSAAARRAAGAGPLKDDHNAEAQGSSAARLHRELRAFPAAPVQVADADDDLRLGA